MVFDWFQLADIAAFLSLLLFLILSFSVYSTPKQPFSGVLECVLFYGD